MKIDNITIKSTQSILLSDIETVKEFDKFYFGFIHGDGIGIGSQSKDLKITITEENVVNYIKYKLKGGLGTKITVTLDDSTTYLIDTISVKDDCCSVSFTLKPNTSVFDVFQNEKTKYIIPLDETISVPVKTLPDKATFKGVDKIETTKSHVVPFLINESPVELGIVKDTNIEQVFIFSPSSTDTYRIYGAIKTTVYSSVNGVFIVALEIDGKQTIIETLPTTTTNEALTIAIDVSLPIPSNSTVYLKTITSLVGDFQIQYDDTSNLTIEKESQSTIEWKSVKAVSVRNGFKTIIEKSSGGKVSLNRYIFDNDFFDGYLTNNKGLVNNQSFVNVSLKDLFEELRNKYPIGVDLSLDNLISIIPACEVFKCPKPLKIKPTSISREINEDVLYGAIKVGYNNWKADSKLSDIEYNSTREYSNTGAGSSTLSLLNDWSASGFIMSEQMLKEEQKEEIHWITVHKSTLKAETNEYISSTIYKSDASINLRITPTRNLARWSQLLLLNYEFTSGTGNFTMNSTDSYINECHEKTGFIDENTYKKLPSLLGLYKYELEIKKCDLVSGFFHRAKCLKVKYCGDDKVIFVTKIENKQSDSYITVQAIELA